MTASLTVRAKGSVSQLTVKYQFFLLMPSLILKFWNCPSHKRCKKALFPDFWYLRHTDIGSNKAFISLNHFPQNISFKLHILCPQQSQVCRSKVRTLKEVFPLLFLLNLPGLWSPIYKSLKFKFPYKYLSLIVILAPHTGLQQISFF